jgi:osmotically-inducible protein OsmY
LTRGGGASAFQPADPTCYRPFHKIVQEVPIVQEDRALEQQVKAALTHSGHFDWQKIHIDVSVRNGSVTLRGTLPTLRDKRRAEDIARRVSGVKELCSVLRLAPLVSRSDEEVARVVRDALYADRNLDATGIDIAVKDGVVSLRGIMGTPMQRRVVVATIWWLRGVQDVKDELTVLYPEEDGDDELEDACRIMLDKDPLVDEAEVSVLGENGVITLAGAVGSEVERDAAENTVWGIPGVKGVHNHLLVVPGEMPAGEREMGI